jgi:hypothetical protein
MLNTSDSPEVEMLPTLLRFPVLLQRAGIKGLEPQ